MTRSSTEALPGEFYDRPVVEVAEALIGCTVSFEGVGRSPIGGVIVETEATYIAPTASTPCSTPSASPRASARQC
jgi:3-methyladenine DNA glycosylase Mpg